MWLVPTDQPDFVHQQNHSLLLLLRYLIAGYNPYIAEKIENIHINMYTHIPSRLNEGLKQLTRDSATYQS